MTVSEYLLQVTVSRYYSIYHSIKMSQCPNVTASVPQYQCHNIMVSITVSQCHSVTASQEQSSHQHSPALIPSLAPHRSQSKYGSPLLLTGCFFLGSFAEVPQQGHDQVFLSAVLFSLPALSSGRVWAPRTLASAGLWNFIGVAVATSPAGRPCRVLKAGCRQQICRMDEKLPWRGDSEASAVRKHKLSLGC